MATQKRFRVGCVTVYIRGSTWYLRYHENGRRRQVRVGTDKDSARQLAAQVNAQLEMGTPAATSFEPIDLVELRQRWLDHHEHVLRSAVATIKRYRTASQHLLDFVRHNPVRHVSHFRAAHAELFVRYLRNLEVAPNGHPNSAKRRLRDKGLTYVLEVARCLFTFALKRRHLPPYTENPFTTIQIDRFPVEDAKPVIPFNAEQERQFLEACDDWQLPIFATLMMTGLRTGELLHLLLPDDVDLFEGWLRIRNKADLGWQVKTRNERRVPLVPELVEALKIVIGARNTGPLFRRRLISKAYPCAKAGFTQEQIRAELLLRQAQQNGVPHGRAAQQRLCRRLWIEMGLLPETRLRSEFIKLTAAIGLPQVTAPKTLRHQFATSLQEANMDPMIRWELMGHVGGGEASSKGPLGMTGVYSHASAATIRRQLENAMRERPVTLVLRKWLDAQRQEDSKVLAMA